MDFYLWILQFLTEQSPRGRLATTMLDASDDLPMTKLIDSFEELVDLTDENCKERYIENLGDGFNAIMETLWLDFCRDTGHPINPSDRVPE